MPVEELTPGAVSANDAPAAAARRLMRLALKASLSTLLNHVEGHPYASLVLTATEPDGAPIFLISRLAMHTKNLEKDARVSLLIDGTAGPADPMTGERLTLIGHARPTSSPTALPRFLSRHPSADAYAAFTDFSMYAIHIDQGHYIGGFGKIVGLSPADLLCVVRDAQELIAAEADILHHMNSDHRDAVALYATELAQCAAGDWRICGIDPEGFDLLHRNKAARVAFPTAVRTPAQARLALVALAKEARLRQPAGASPRTGA